MKVYFQHPSLELTPREYALCRFLMAVFFSFWFGLAFFLLFSGANLWLGGLMLFIWLHNAVYRNRARHSLLRARLEAEVLLNLDDYLNGRARSVILGILTRLKLSPEKPFELLLLESLSGLKFFGSVFSRMQLSPEEFVVEARLVSGGKAEQEKEVLFNRFLTETFSFAKSFSLTEICPEAFLVGLRKAKIFEGLWTKYKASEALLEIAVAATLLSKKVAARPQAQTLAVFNPKLLKGRMVDRSWTSLPTPTLNAYGEDLTHLAFAGEVGYLIGHEEELSLAVNILSRETKNNLLLLGEPGTGKQTIIWHLAELINQDRVPARLFDKRLVRLNLAEIFGRPIGEGEAILSQIITEVIKTRDVLLFLPDLEMMVVKPGMPGLNILTPIIRSNSLPLIATVDLVNYQRYLSSNPLIVEQFEVIKVSEVSETEAVKVVTLEALVAEKQNKIVVSSRAIERCVFLAKRFLRPKALPSSAVDLLLEAVSQARQRKIPLITAELIDELVTAKVGVPIKTLTQEETNVLLNLETLIHQRLINQDEAVKEVSEAIRVYRAGLSRKKGTIGTFLFVGPTGVGKTELSKVLANVYFGGEANLIRFDMSKYQEQATIKAFIGSPDGLVLGQFTEAVRQKPFSLILLDEFEKAHPDILELFLPIFDEGMVADALGRETDFRNTIIICTSNAHSVFIKESIERGVPIAEITAQLKMKLTDYFKPELINRFSSVVVFRPLGQEEVKKIALIFLKEVENLLKDRGMTLAVSESALSQLAKEGYDPVFGARTLNRVINERLRDRLAEKILSREFVAGDKIGVDYQEGAYTFVRR